MKQSFRMFAFALAASATLGLAACASSEENMDAPPAEESAPADTTAPAEPMSPPPADATPPPETTTPPPAGTP